MDKRTILAIVLIGLVFLGYYFITSPSKEERAEMQRVHDSIAHDQMVKDSIFAQEQLIKALEEEKLAQEALETDSTSIANKDSIENINMMMKYGMFANAAKGDNNFTVIETNKMIITFANLGGKISSVELKDYKTYYQEPLVMYQNGEESEFGLELLVDGKPLVTNHMYFTPSVNGDTIMVTDKEFKFAMRISAADKKYLEYAYTIRPDDYMIDFGINIIGLQKEIANNPYITMKWIVDVPALERGRDWESQNTTVFLKMTDDDIEDLNPTKAKDDFNSHGSAKWIAYKQQFFSSILIAEDKLDSPAVYSEKIENASSPYLKNFNSQFAFDVPNGDVNQKFTFYFGPNKYSELKSYDMGLEKVIPLGRNIISWVNKYAIIPLFNLLGKTNWNYGIIILIMTFIIKIVLFPLTYKSYMSTAKMRVLKPQLDELAKKYPKGKEAERQQAQMSLYQKAGVSPMGGCLPLLLQFPILVAMFRFFPASIELRQQAFLWANDLSSYDAIVQWNAHIPILSSIYGNHISLFALLMAISMLIQQKITSSTQDTSAMPGMKFMLYFMPIMMLCWFNKYSSGLSYYYLLANIISIAQTWIIQKFVVNEKKLLAEIESNKKKPKAKSRWMQKLEEASKAQQQQLKNQKRN